MKKKFWVSFVKYAGVEVEAENENEAEEIANQIDESEYEHDQIFGDAWQFSNAEQIED